MSKRQSKRQKEDSEDGKPKRYIMISAAGALVAIALALYFMFMGRGSPLPEEDPQLGSAIEALGGMVVRDESIPGKPVIKVEFTKVTDGDLKEVARLKRLRSLSLAGTQVTDAGLKELAGLKTLGTLNLAGTKVTDAGLKELAPLKNLHRLNLKETQVTDEGVANLRKTVHYCDIER